jgi:predicted amidohydrolase
MGKTTMKDLRVALAITGSTVGQNQKNLENAAHWAGRARKEGAALICFPELNLTGYSNHPDMGLAAEPIPGPCSQGIESIARAEKIVVLAGLAERSGDGRIFASHLVAHPDRPVQIYRKLHLAPPELETFSPGVDAPLFSANDATFGIQLCYDAHFPELTTRMALEGADIIFTPHASPRGAAAQKHQSWMRHLPARAYDNGVFVLSVNQVGENGRGLTFPGNAVAISPSGEIMATELSGKEGLLTVDLRSEDLTYVRDHRMRYFLPNRRPDLYCPEK